ncbi:MAG: methyltransferase family protein [Planctomycetota bacterium]|jgi:protein-S-isoprenylcysteine O-methyltransferase Ste14
MSTLIRPESTASTQLETHVFDLGRAVGFCFGIGTQLLFLCTVVYLYLFLRYCEGTPYAGWWWKDALMATGFAVPHSIILFPPIAKKIHRWVPGELMGCLHCMVTCVSLLLMFRCWGSSGVVLWETTGVAASAVLACFYLSWAALLYSLYCTGFGYQTGLTQWWYWWRQTPPPRRPFLTTGAFRYMRHPVYMSFLGLVWFTPAMTLDHAILTAVWTIYIYAGSWAKDRRLLHFIGDEYRAYARRVPGLPLIGFGSLNRFKS